MSRPRSSLLLLPLVLLLALSGCADRQPESGGRDKASADFPVSLHPEGAPSVTLDSQPSRIVSLSPSTTETLFALGAGKQVVAVDKSSTYPKQAPKTSLDGINIDPEAIAEYSPDLVITESDTDGKLAKVLAKTDTTTLVLPAPTTLPGAYDQFELVGKATGHAAEGERLAKRTKTRVDELVAGASDGIGSGKAAGTGLSYYHELDPTFYSVTSATFIGQIYDRFGLTNIADAGGKNKLGGYPQLSAERVVQANPDLVFLADTTCCGQSAKTVAARPGWDTLTAVRDGDVFAMNDDIASRWSPRLVKLAETIADAIKQAQ